MNQTAVVPLRLTRLERESELWKKLSAHLRAELEIKRRKNDSATNDIKDTTLLRGEIATLKRILALADEAGQEARPHDTHEGADTAYPASGG